MRFKIALLSCGLLLIGGLAFLAYERERYNVVSREEILIVHEKLKVLSPQEKQDLTYFINWAISSDPYPYTLTGYKPMSITNVLVEDVADASLHERETLKNPNHQKLKRGYLVWEKYQSYFPRKKYLLINYPFLRKGKKEVALICSKACVAVIQEHLEDFRGILGKPYTSEEVFGILTHPEHADFHKIIDRTCLVGILLGFGRNNAYLYEQYRGGPSRSNITWNQQLMNDSLQFFSGEWPLPGRLLLPNFACDPSSEETQKLKNHYCKARKIIRWTYFLRNNLEVTLALLMQN